MGGEGTFLGLNWLAIGVGTVGYQVLGMLWYGPLFGGTWMDAMGDESSEDVDADGNTGYALAAVGSLIATPALAVLLELAGVSTPAVGIGVGLLGRCRPGGDDEPPDRGLRGAGPDGLHRLRGR